MGYEFYDTNIVIFLLDEMKKDEAKVLRFLEGKKILVTNRSMGEIRQRKTRNLEFAELVSSSEFYFVNPDTLLESEIKSFYEYGNNSHAFLPNRLDAWLVKFLKDGVSGILPHDAKIKETVFQNYGGKIQGDVGKMHDEKQLRFSISLKVHNLAKDMGIHIPLQSIKYRNFPSIFVLDYVWWLRFSRSSEVVVEPNDLYDLLNISIADYVTHWVGERSFAASLKQFKGRSIPTTGKVLQQFLIKEGVSSKSVEELIDNMAGEPNEIEKGLPFTEIVSYSEFTDEYHTFK